MEPEVDQSPSQETTRRIKKIRERVQIKAKEKRGERWKTQFTTLHHSPPALHPAFGLYSRSKVTRGLSLLIFASTHAQAPIRAVSFPEQ